MAIKLLCYSLTERGWNYVSKQLCSVRIVMLEIWCYVVGKSLGLPGTVWPIYHPKSRTFTIHIMCSVMLSIL